MGRINANYVKQLETKLAVTAQDSPHRPQLEQDLADAKRQLDEQEQEKFRPRPVKVKVGSKWLDGEVEGEHKGKIKVRASNGKLFAANESQIREVE